MPEQKILPLSAVVPTKDRAKVLARTLRLLISQSCIPREIIVVDASSTNQTELELRSINFPQSVSVVYEKAVVKGAAQQRIQAIQLSTSNFIFFMDDDIIFEEWCVERLFNGFMQGARVGGVNAMITNQRYTTPGFVTRTMYIILSGQRLKTWAGKAIGPVWNLLPEDEAHLPDYVECEWLNTTCTMYRKAALPNPLFPDSFHGYSSFEDVTLSLNVAKNWTLLNARTARIFHDSQPGDYKSNPVHISEMEVVNRHYVMTQVMGHRKVKHYGQLFLFEMFKLAAMFASPSQIRALPRVILGKMKGYIKIIFS